MNRLTRAVRRRLNAQPQTLASENAYALWAESYPPTAHNRLMQLEQAAMSALMPPLAGLAVLDLACGTGRYGLIAQAAGAQRVAGIDTSAAMLKASPLSDKLALAAMTAIPFQAASFDVILCGLATGHLPATQMQQSIREIARVLRPGGVALISDFHPFMFLNGGRRTFTAPNGDQYAVEHYPHLISDYLNAIHDAGLHLTSLAEPRAEGMNAPAVLVLKISKPI